MGLLNRLWSQADFWDKEENKQQAQQMAPKPQPARAPRSEQGNFLQRNMPSFESGVSMASKVSPALKHINTAMTMANRTNFGKSLTSGFKRSAIGTGQAASGLYDLATPGKGTNRVSDYLDNEAKKLDTRVKQQNLPQVGYKAGQFAGEVSTGLGIGSAAKLGAKTLVKQSPKIAQVASGLGKVNTGVGNAVTRATTPLASKGVGGRIAANTIRNVANPKYQAANAGWSAMQMGKEASAGHKITPARVGTDLAIGGVAFPAGGAVLGEGARGIRNIATKGTNIHPLHRDQWGYNKDAVVGAFKGDTRQRQSARAFQELQSKKADGPFVTSDGLDVGLSRKGNRKIASTAAKLPNAEFSLKQRLAPRINSVIGESKYIDSSPDSKLRGFAKDGFDYNKTPVTYRGNRYDATLNIARNNIAGNNLYEVNIKKAPRLPEERITSGGGVYTDSIPNSKRNVNVPEPTNLHPNAEANVFAQNPLAPRTQAHLGGDVPQITSPKVGPSPTRVHSQATTPSVHMPPEHPSVTKFVKEYAQHLKRLEDEASGGQLVPDGRGGYKRITDHSPFYRSYFKENKRKPSMSAWEDEARLQLESGTAGFGFDEGYKQVVADANNPELQSLLNQKQPKTLTPFEQNQQNAKNLRREVLDYRNTLTPVKKTGGESNIPVRKVTQQGDVVTKTNVNPNIKAGEKRYTMNDNGELLPDTNGAYRLFHGEDGKINGFRIGDEYFDAKDLGDLSQVNNYGSMLATQRRNIERAYGAETGAKVNGFLVDYQQSQATKLIERQVQFKKDMQAMANDLGISFGVGRRNAKKVSAAIQDFGEGRRNQASLVQEFGKDQAERIIRADRWFRSQYDTLLDEANTTLTKHGYDPIPKRKDYYTHFSEPSVWQKFGLKMQEIRDIASPTMQDSMPSAGRGKISNALAGQSEFMLPNKRFNPFAQQRKGDVHTSDAFQSFERYLAPTLNNIYMTPAITRGRVLERAVTEAATLEGKDANKVIIQIREWSNRLAGKSNRIGDRLAADSNWGPKLKPK